MIGCSSPARLDEIRHPVRLTVGFYGAGNIAEMSLR
jgi:hypothetical protein